MKNQIKCPKCGEVFSVDEATYASILEQVKNQEFEKELQKRIELEKEKNNQSLILLEEKNKKEIIELQAKLELLNKEKEIAVQKAKQENIETINNLKKDISNLEMQSKVQEADNNAKSTELRTKLEKEIALLQGQLDATKDKEEALKSKLDNEHKLEVQRLQDQIDYYKDLKAKMSTKLVGETLEQHCKIKFEQIRPFVSKNVYFEKDNQVSNESGSKGDFIYRETTDDGVEILSIMFEMKNENDTTSTKHKNEDFFKELNKDRLEKKCEYAVLVSMLEAEDELYNAGIVDVSHKFEKMYVVRPQCFIPIITLLRNAAMNSLSYRNELAVIRNQNIDITNFENSLTEFQTSMTKNYESAKNKFDSAIEEIDKTITHLQKVKDSLLGSEKNLRIASEKANELTIKKLTKNNQTMKEMFDNLNK